MGKRLYFDYAASAPLDPRVREAMDEAAALAGNPSSLHEEGRLLRAMIDRARAQVARLLAVESEEVVFTSGATESNALALVGLFRSIRAAAPGRALRVLASPLEHSSMAGSLTLLEEEYGAIVEYLPVGEDGIVRIGDLASAVKDDTAIVCLMWANNVLGTVQPVAEAGRSVAEAAARRGPGGLPLYFVCDAVQAVGTIDVAPRRAGVDALTLSGHKICGPKGIGACVLRRGLSPRPFVVGGGQERGFRHGTENAAAIAGLGRAAEIIADERAGEAGRLRRLREAFLAGLAAAAPSLRLVGSSERSVPGIAYLVAPRERGDVLALKLDAAGVAVSSGSACDSGHRRPSHVLRAVRDEQTALRGGVRISFGRFTTEGQIKDLLGRLEKVIGR